ncbi:hypothetical protein [Tenggerimyces flavus]|uniref:Uncharacterized protein n=1 Tax=Tenggerimyces flavus TaxID=1708749 RepID=A0ABV7YQT3_9ACTN|nr:hypothetical protein [Tenggerimyces flavus]MBM7786497.1 F0F1-type ATP synthase assembly protein I [Tenggerimyces flavus]
MTLTISLVVVLAVAAIILFKFAHLKPLHAVICALFGFTLATTGLADPVRDVLDGIVSAIGRALAG